MIRLHTQHQFISLDEGGFRIQLHKHGFISDPDIGFIDFADERYMLDDPFYPVGVFIARVFRVDEFRSQAENQLIILFKDPLMAGNLTNRSVDDRVLFLLTKEFCRNQVRPTDKVGDELVIRVKVDLPRRAKLNDFSFVHHPDHIGEGKSFDAVMGNIDSGNLEFGQELSQLFTGFFPQLCIKV